MTQRELTIIEQLLIDYHNILIKREDVRSQDDVRQLNRVLRAVANEKQNNRNRNLHNTFKQWLKNTWTYLFGK